MRRTDEASQWQGQIRLGAAFADKADDEVAAVAHAIHAHSSSL
jgi:hypothetical protein